MDRAWRLLILTLCGGLFQLSCLRDEPVLSKLNLDIGAVRPRAFCIMNPFRDFGPELAAGVILTSLTHGRAREIGYLVQKENLGPVVEYEGKYPISSWRIGHGVDGQINGQYGSSLMYWVRRRGGYPGEQEVHIETRRIGEIWSVVGFVAIY